MPRQALNLSAGYLGVVFGTVGIGFAWRYASTLQPVSHSTGDGLVMLMVVMQALLSMAFINRAIRSPASVLREMRHPASDGFISLLPATILLVTIRLVPQWRSLALGLFVPGAALQPARAAQQSGSLWRGTHSYKAITPGLYLPTVTNNFVSAMACDVLGFADTGLVFLGAGILPWLSLEPTILQCLHGAGELPTPPHTLLRIRLAPTLVACSAWPSVNGGEADTFAKLLFGYGLLQLLLMLRLMPWYLHRPLSASFWSFSFGISTLTATGLRLGQARADGFFHHLAMPLFIFNSPVVGLLLLCTTLLLVSRRLLVQVGRETLLNKKEGLRQRVTRTILVINMARHAPIPRCCVPRRWCRRGGH